MSQPLPKEELLHNSNDIVGVRDTAAATDAPRAAQSPSAELLEHVKVAQDIIRDAFRHFAAAEIGISFNGGKDSIVMFELVRRTVPADVLAQCCIFVVDLRDEFEEVRDFRAQYMREHAPGLTLVHQEVEVDMRESLFKLMAARPLKAVLMGTRKSDPHGRYQNSAVEMTTPGWPEFFRVCPIFGWSVCNVWEYTRLHNIPQCKLYEDGYTSLGSTANTARNPQLRRSDGTYRPAWEMMGNDGERQGRHQV